MSDTAVKPLVIIGSGPSALTAAIYAAREDISVTIYEKAGFGGLAATTDWVDNYPGFPDGISGMELTKLMQQQAKRFGAVLDYGEVSDLQVRDDGSIELLVDGRSVLARQVIIATGSSYRQLGIPGEAEYMGRGVHYCATCDGAFYRDKRLIVVGGGNSAVQEAIFLTKFASHIDMLVRSEIKASEILQKELQKLVEAGKITVHLGATPQQIHVQDGHVAGMRVQQSEQERIIESDGVFVFIGLLPNTAFLQNSPVKLDNYGFVAVDEHLATNVPGVFASGDVRSNGVLQIAAAVGDGARVAISAREQLQH